jgi:LPXTG-motif cell wall-anchored protein
MVSFQEWSMSTNRIIGLVLLAVGGTLLFFGYNSSQSVGERIVEGITGHFTNQTMWFLFGGIAALVGGAALVFWGGRRSTP